MNHLNPPDLEAAHARLARRLRDQYGAYPDFDDDGASYREACRQLGYIPEDAEITEEDL